MPVSLFDSETGYSILAKTSPTTSFGWLILSDLHLADRLNKINFHCT